MPAMADTYDNGGMDPQPGGCNGDMYSQIEAPSNVYGNNTLVGAFHQADDFTVPSGQTWDISQLTWYLYQTNAPVTEPLVDVFVQIWNGNPMLGGSLIAGDMTTDRLTSSTFSGVYRVSAITECARAVKECKIDMTWLAPLGAGTYWIEIGSNGNVAYSGPWANHVVPRDGNENSIFYTVGTATWAVNAANGVGWDYPFKLEYSGGGGGYTLSVTGSCPGNVTISWTGAGSGQHGLVLGNQLGQTTIPQTEPCAGTILGIQGGVMLIDPPGIFSTGGGSGSISGNCPGAVSGKRVQGVKGGTPCTTSNVIQLP
jgi:hypothetical protein